MDWRAFGQAFVTLVVILDPLGNVPAFLALTRGFERRAQNSAVYVSVLTAAAILAVFAAFGAVILRYLSISLESLMVAGGVLLFIVALDMLRGGGSTMTPPEDASIALVPLGTPFIAGPGAIVATIVLTRQHPSVTGRLAVAGAAALALVVVLVSLRFASALSRILRPSAIHFVTRIMGLLLTAIAVQLAAGAIAVWVRTGVH